MDLRLIQYVHEEILVEFGTAAIFAQQKLWDVGGYGTVSSQNDQGPIS